MSTSDCVRRRSGTFLGRARVHNSGKLVDLSSALLGAGLARLHPTFQPDRQPGGRELLELEQAAKDKRLKVPAACGWHVLRNTREQHAAAPCFGACRRSFRCPKLARCGVWHVPPNSFGSCALPGHALTCMLYSDWDAGLAAAQIWEKYDPATEAAAAGENGDAEANGVGGGEELEVVVTEVRFASCGGC